MKHIIETGTDVATICFFDPEALPPDFDEHAKQDPYEAVAKLSKEGRIWSQETGADGGYLFHFYVEEEVPERIRKHSHEPQVVPRLLAPSGRIWACGIEYAARDPEKGQAESPGSLTEFPHMGGKCEVPPGDYSVTVWRAEWPDGLVENELKKRGASGHNALGVTTGVLFLTTLIGTLFTLVKTLKKSVLGELGRNYLWTWCVLILAWIACVLLMRKLSKLEKDPNRKEVESEFPSIVVQMKRIPAN